MEWDELSPIAIIAGVLGALIGFIIIKRMSGAEYEIGFLWKALTPIACGLGSFFIIQKMMDNENE